MAPLWFISEDPAKKNGEIPGGGGPVSPPVHESVGVASSIGFNFVRIPALVDVEENDLILLEIACDGDPTSVHFPWDFTVLETVTDSINQTTYKIGWKIATYSEPSEYCVFFDNAADENMVVAVHRISNFDPEFTIIESVALGSTGSVANLALTGITTVQDNAMIFTGIASDKSHGDGMSPNFTPNSQPVDNQLSGGTAGVWLNSSEETKVTAGATGSKQWNQDGSNDECAGVVLGINGDFGGAFPTLPSLDPASPARVLDVSSNNTTSGTSVEVTLTTDVDDGDLLIAHVVGDGALISTITPPSGWDLIDSETGAGAFSSALYSKIASSETGAYTWSWTPTEACIITIVQLDNTDDSSPGPITQINPAAEANRTGFALDGVTTLNDNSLIFSFVGFDKSAADTLSPQNNGEIVIQNLTIGGTAGVFQGIAYNLQEEAGPSGARMWEVNTTDEAQGWVIAVGAAQ